MDQQGSIQGLCCVREAGERAVEKRISATIRPAAGNLSTNPATDKEALARQVALERKITSGLVCAISTLEPSPTFEHRGTHIIQRVRPCNVLYQYQIHPEMGWMSTTSADYFRPYPRIR